MGEDGCHIDVLHDHWIAGCVPLTEYTAHDHSERAQPPTKVKELVIIDQNNMSCWNNDEERQWLGLDLAQQIFNIPLGAGTFLVGMMRRLGTCTTKALYAHLTKPTI